MVPYVPAQISFREKQQEKTLQCGESWLETIVTALLDGVLSNKMSF